MRPHSIVRILVSLTALSVAVVAQPHHISRVEQAPKLSRVVRGQAPAGMSHVTGFRQRTPNDGKDATQSTDAYLAYDNTNLYVLFDCTDAPHSIRTRLAKRENIGEDDTVSVYLDTFLDRRTAYVFSLNASGVQRDGLVREGTETDFRFDAVWQSETRLFSDGFLALFSIPFKSIRFSGTAAQIWGIALNRSLVRNNESSYWPYITNNKPGFVPQFGQLDGIENISPSHNVALIPYIAAARSRSLTATGYDNDTEVRGGLDAKIVLRNAFTLDATLNPDFSQVESDDPQVTINQRFEVYFPEKRPFFLENASLFETPINLFFSRRIVDPAFGARLTGKVGPWAVGVMATDDRAAGQRFSSNSLRNSERAFNGLVRIQRDFNSQSRIGFLSASTQNGNTSNHVISLDARVHLSRLWFLTGQYSRTFDTPLNRPTKSASGYTVDLARYGQHFISRTSYLDLAPDFKASLGYVPRVDVRNASQYMGYLWRPESSRILSYGPSLTATGIWNHSGRLTDRFINAEFAVDFKGPIGFRGSRFDGYTYYLGQGFNEERSGASFYDSHLRWCTIYGGFGAGTGINYSPGGTLAPFLAASSDANFGFTARLSPHATLTEYYYLVHLGDPVYPDPANGLPRTSVFTSHVARSKLNYQFTRAFSVRAIFDYYSQLPNEALIQNVKYKQITGDVLFTYLLNPGTALYLGYTNRHANVSEPERPDYMPPVVRPNTLTGRTLFFKLSYYFQP